MFLKILIDTESVSIYTLIPIDTNMNTDKNVQVGVRLPPNTIKKIDKIVSNGDAMNRADAVRNIVRKAVEQEE